MTSVFARAVETKIGTFTIEFDIDPKGNSWTYLWKSPAKKVLRGPLGYPFASIEAADAAARREIGKWVEGYLANKVQLFMVGSPVTEVSGDDDSGEDQAEGR